MGACNSRGRRNASLEDIAVLARTSDDHSSSIYGDASDAAAVASFSSSRIQQRSQRRIRRQEEARLGEIVALQQSLAAMEEFFQSLLGQTYFYMEAFDPNNNPTAPPPASKAVLENLPLRKENIPTDTVCGICGGGGGDDATQPQVVDTCLPCGHYFHKESCILVWLERHCTCPVCRYELPTDDESYESGRVERMASRKLVIEEQHVVLEDVVNRNKVTCQEEDDLEEVPLTDEEVVVEEIANEEVANEEVASEEIANEEIANEEVANEEVANEEVASEEIANEEVANEEIANEEVANEEVVTPAAEKDGSRLTEEVASPEDAALADDASDSNSSVSMYRDH